MALNEKRPRNPSNAPASLTVAEIFAQTVASATALSTTSSMGTTSSTRLMAFASSGRNSVPFASASSAFRCPEREGRQEKRRRGEEEKRRRGEEEKRRRGEETGVEKEGGREVNGLDGGFRNTHTHPNNGTSLSRQAGRSRRESAIGRNPANVRLICVRVRSLSSSPLPIVSTNKSLNQNGATMPSWVSLRPILKK